MTARAYDLAVVGAGICGLAHALAAARRGKRVVVIDRDAQANGASIRNFGFITVTGETEMGRDCRILAPAAIADSYAGLRAATFAGALHSPHEIRVESRDAIPRLAAYLEERHDVTILRDTVVRTASPPRLETSRGPVEAETVVVCPGDDFRTLHADRIAAYGLVRCKLHMMRVRPERFDERLPPVMSDLGLVRYLGYAEQPAAAALKTRLLDEQGEHLTHGIHLIVVRSADGSLVVVAVQERLVAAGLRAPAGVDALILDEYARVFDGPIPDLVEHWTGTYASAADRLMLVDRPSDALRIVIVTSGTGASTSFAIGEDVVAELYG